MNPFVNLKKRSVSLPKGCKDHLDVLQHPKRKGSDPIRSFILLVLMDAQQEHANEVIIGVAPEYGGETPMRFKAGDTLRESAFPSDIRSLVVAELGRMAALPDGQFPKEGTFSVRLESTQLAWRVRIGSPDAEIILTHIED
jgi:hypothetical protein